MIDYIEQISDYLENNIQKTNSIFETIQKKEDLNLNNLYDLITTLEMFKEFVEQLENEDFDFDQLKSDNIKLNYNSLNEFKNAGIELSNSLKNTYLKKLEEKYSKGIFDNSFDKFFCYTELAKCYLDLESNKFYDIRNEYTNIIKENPNEIIEGYLNKKELTYSDCQFLNDIIIEFKDSQNLVNFEKLKERLLIDSKNENQIVSKGPKDTLMYLESYFENKEINGLN